MPKQRGPKTHKSKGLQPKVQITISIPAELHDMINDLIDVLADNRSAVISELLKRALIEQKMREVTMEKGEKGPINTVNKIDLANVLRHLSWPTICEMIEQLTESQNDDAETFRQKLESYMTKVWPDKKSQYLSYRETMKISPAQTLANEIHQQVND